MANALVETTVFTDALLKPGGAGKAAKDALLRYDVTELPVYAIKEFASGPLKHFIWFHNKLVTSHSFANAIDALQRMSLTPRRYTTSTALEALREAAEKTGRTTTSEMVRSYGPAATLDSIQRDKYRLAIKAIITRAWQKRRSLVSRVVFPLECYEENDIVEEGGLLVSNSTDCAHQLECSISRELRKDGPTLKKLKAVVDASPPKPENQRRSQALRHLIRTPKREFPHEMCRALGDAVFAFCAPLDSTILTTNLRDIEPLAKALGKSVECPKAS